MDNPAPPVRLTRRETLIAAGGMLTAGPGLAEPVAERLLHIEHIKAGFRLAFERQIVTVTIAAPGVATVLKVPNGARASAGFFEVAAEPSRIPVRYSGE